MASTWSITLSCGCCYRLRDVPDLMVPYMCSVHAELRSVDMAVRNKEGGQ